MKEFENSEYVNNEAYIVSVPKRWLNVKEFTTEYGISATTQQTLRKSKSIPFSKMSNFIFYDRLKISEWLEAHAIVK